MTSARFQPFCKKDNINIGCFDRTRINPRNLTQRDAALKKRKPFLFNLEIRRCYFDKAIKESKDNFKIVDNVISDEHVKSFIKYEYNPKKYLL